MQFETGRGDPDLYRNVIYLRACWKLSPDVFERGQGQHG